MMMRRTIGLSLALLVASLPALARQAQHGHAHPLPTIKSKSAAHAAAACKSSTKRRQAGGQSADRLGRRQRGQASQHAAKLPPPDRYIGQVRPIGARQVGYAAWYGGWHVGRRTASGQRLDTVHATAAHRSLPLFTLVRVTNLRNGRSVVAEITDRGPVSRRLLIDVSPSAAEQLDMLHSGIANVSIEPVAEAAASSAAGAAGDAQ